MVATLMIGQLKANGRVQVGSLWYIVEDDHATVTYEADNSSNYDTVRYVTIPASITLDGSELAVTAIGDRAFAQSGGIKQIHIPRSVCSIGEDAFTSMPAFRQFTSDDNGPFTAVDDVLYYGQKLFKYPQAKTGILTIPSGITQVVDKACAGANVTEVRCGQDLLWIGREAFAACYLLHKIVLDDNLLGIKEFAFQGCSELTGTLHIPASLRELADNAIYDTQFDSIIVDGWNNQFDSRDGVMTNKSGRQIIHFPNARTHYDFPADITSIGSHAFHSSSLTGEVVLPEHLSTIEASAFSGSDQITSFVLDANLTSIGNNAFDWCKALQSITCLATLSPECGSDVFLGVDKSIPLYVPEEALNDYRTAPIWSEFSNIQPISTEGIENVQRDDVQSTKVLRDGVLLIERNGRTYNAQGQTVR